MTRRRFSTGGLTRPAAARTAMLSGHAVVLLLSFSTTIDLFFGCQFFGDDILRLRVHKVNTNIFLSNVPFRE